MNDTSVYFPYAVASLASYAWKFNDISDNYELKEIFFLRESFSSVIASLEAPYLVGFSNYIWNFEYNKALAKKIKRKFPKCIIVFGGPQICENFDLLKEYDFIDILMFNEGEIPFCDLLRAYQQETSIEFVNNIAFRDSNGYTKTTEFKTFEIRDIPSPYQSGVFDILYNKNPNLEFIPLIETNRGCPNGCSYCSWGHTKSKTRMFPIERVLFDIEWVSSHKMDFLGIADANFGMFPRDEIITDKIIECFKKTGYPKKFQVSYSKGAENRVFNISKKLNLNGLDKGVTLSFQTMSSVAQKNIGRSNMDIKYYKQLLEKYSKEKIPTYTDLILGLPGETFESFKNGIDDLLNSGQHTSLFVHLCEWLPMSEMGQKEYMDKYEINYTVIPLNQPHRNCSKQTDIQEYSRIITSTYSMSTDDWKNTVMFSTAVLTFHHLGLLQLVAIYLHFETGLKYSVFYSDFVSFLLSDNCKFSIFKDIKNKIDAIINNNSEPVIFDNLFGDIAWPFEEYAFLKTLLSKKDFYSIVNVFLENYISNDVIRNDLISYQQFVLKEVDTPRKNFSGNYEWNEYFKSILYNNYHLKLEEKSVSYHIFDKDYQKTWLDYAKKVLWFGRRGGQNMYTYDEISNEMTINE